MERDNLDNQIPLIIQVSDSKEKDSTAEEAFEEYPEVNSPKTLSFLSLVRTMNSWTSFLVLLILGTSILISPAAILLWMNENNFPSLENQDIVYLSSTEQNVIRFSFFFTCIWVLYLLIHFAFQVAPFLIRKFAVFHLGYASEGLLQKLDCNSITH